jgi:hypothetical protein
MAAPQKEGLEYFPVDVDMAQDDKIYMIEVECGLEGFGLLMKLLMNELIDKARGLKEERDRLQREVSQLEQELAISEELD